MIEDNYSDCDMPIAVAPRNNEVLLLQMDGEMTKEQLSEAVGLALEAGKKVSAAQRDALREAYAKAGEEKN